MSTGTAASTPRSPEGLDRGVPHLEGEEVQGGGGERTDVLGPADLAQRRRGRGRHGGVLVRLEQRDEHGCRGPDTTDAAQVGGHGARPGVPLLEGPRAGRRRCRSPSPPAPRRRHRGARRRGAARAAAGARPAGRRPARPCAPPGNAPGGSGPRGRAIAASSPSTSRQQPMRCSPRTRRAAKRAVRPAHGVAQRALLAEQLDQLLGRLTAHLAEQLHDQVVQVAPAAAGRRAEAAQGLAVLGVLAGRDADDEGAQRVRAGARWRARSGCAGP